MAFGAVNVNTLLDAVIVVGGLLTSRKLAAGQGHIKNRQNDISQGQAEIHDLVNSNLTRVTNQLAAVNQQLLDVKGDAIEQIAALRTEVLNLRELSMRESEPKGA